MNILVTIPSNIEAEILIPRLSSFRDFDFLVSGVGIHNTIFSTTRALLKKEYDIVLQLGIAGSFSSDINKGSVVVVDQDYFADIGFYEKDTFISLEEKGMDNQFSQVMTYEGILPNRTRSVKGITVNTVNRSLSHLNTLRNTFHSDIITMEGAAFYMVCRKLNIPGIQIRGISNMVNEGNKMQWEITPALKKIVRYIKVNQRLWS